MNSYVERTRPVRGFVHMASACAAADAKTLSAAFRGTPRRGAARMDERRRRCLRAPVLLQQRFDRPVGILREGQELGGGNGSLAVLAVDLEHVAVVVPLDTIHLALEHVGPGSQRHHITVLGQPLGGDSTDESNVVIADRIAVCVFQRLLDLGNSEHDLDFYGHHSYLCTMALPGVDSRRVSNCRRPSRPPPPPSGGSD